MRKILIVLMLVISFAVLIYQEYPRILKEYASLFVVDTATKGADAILILGGSVSSRSQKAIELYRDGYASNIWATTVFNPPNKYPYILKTQTQLLADILSYEGIDNLYIVPSVGSRGATSTFDEAYALANFLSKNPLNHLIVVTDGFHTARAELAFKKAFKDLGVKTTLEFAPAFSENFKLDKWYQYESSIFQLLVREPIAMMFYLMSDGNSDLYINE